ncbi:SOSS complex subunit C isoform X4 [Fukomys damarensis]|uniref:SOSS complex subunit C isoform X4 n=1 Tax=Fukomys damarensis TaxID=885580 RepID=UPI0005402B6E|nr:SOSS complex subunit C isoform X4 [Fukomys damarensis]
MAANSSGQGFQNKNRVAILAELDKEKRKLLMQNQSSTNHPGARTAPSSTVRNNTVWNAWLRMNCLYPGATAEHRICMELLTQMGNNRS